MHTTRHRILRRCAATFYRQLCMISFIVGGTLGLCTGILRYRLRQRAAVNVAQSGCFSAGRAGWNLYHVLKTFFYTGISVTDTLFLWCLPWSCCKDWVTHVEGWEEVLAIQNHSNKGMIFLTPHLGCFELAAAWVSHRQPLTSMYRAPRHAWLDRLMRWGRQQGQSSLVPAELKGVRALLKVLKKGGAIGLLPDQVPQQGEGLWVPFFGQPAYTMTLASRLQQSTGANCFLVSAERRIGNAGIHLHFKKLASLDQNLPLNQAVLYLNKTLEDIIRCYPSQYLWGYNRYKVPTGVEAPVKN